MVESSSVGMLHEPDEALARGEALGRYIVIERLGVGATGVVYAAYDPELDRKVAVKILRPQEGGAGESRRQARFVREAKAIAKLAHPNVVGIFDVGVDNGRVFLAMEYLQSGTLREWMAARKRPWREIVKMFIEVGRGLAAAHAEGLVHRDFKPDNVLLDRAGTPKVADFGLARLSGPALEPDSDDGSSQQDAPPEGAPVSPAPLTRTGTLAGTPAYMAPEQFRGRQTDGRTDQFAFCVALHEALYGRRPFEEDTVFDLAESVMREKLLPAPKNANVPGWLRRSLLRGLRADPAQRYPKLDDLLSELQADPVARMRKIVVISVVAVTLVGTFLGLYRRSERRRLEFDGRVVAKITEGRQALAEAHTIKAALVEARGRAFAAFDGARREEGESHWSGARARAAKLEATLKRAQGVLEAALTLEQSNEKARAALADTLLERAALAELEFRKADLAHHLEQMDRHDPSGGLKARRARPGSVTVRTIPPDARIVIEKYEVPADEAGGRLGVVGVGAPFSSPSDEHSLPPGSYRLRATKDGFAETRLPFVVHLGEQLRFDVPLVAASALPADLIYIPAGRFLYGDADEDWRLAFLNAAPIHERSTDAFFIKAHETTFGEWFEFLNDLPAAERKVRTPSSVAVQGGVTVNDTRDGGWAIELNISGYRVAAREHSPLVYPTRRVRPSQNWLRMPVVGISQRDMQAYLAWLSRTGRVPGARFCSEVEWERAARGADERTYPASQSRIADDDTNIDVTYGRVRGSFGPDEVGAHPASESPFGVHDMAGNAWEVVEARNEKGAFLMRGGSYYQASKTAYLTNREPIDLETRSFIVGLRVCAAIK
jgi:formylglycine-generating enzyme required for sulfatase activity